MTSGTEEEGSLDLNALSETIRDDGQVVFSQETEDYGPAGKIYLFHDQYWAWSVIASEFDGHGLIGPFPTLRDAIAGSTGEGLNWVHKYTTSIRAPHLPAAMIVDLLHVEESPDDPFTINGEEWRVDRDRKLVRVSLD